MGPKKDPFQRETRSGTVPNPQGDAPQKNPMKSQEAKGVLQSAEPSLPHPQGDNHPKSAVVLSHDKSRVKCCVVCWKWATFALPDSLRPAVHDLAGVQIDFSDSKVPLGMCSSCKVGLYAYKKTGIN